MSQPTHRHDLAHIGLIPVSQLASGTPTSGMVPTYSGVANAAWGLVGGWGSNPMTAQDDVIVGGAVTGGVAAPARLGKGSDGQVLTVDPTTHHLLWANNAAAERGSSFPAQPAYGNNVPFFRTDLGEWYYYDGTRWLSCTIYTSTPVLNNATVPPWSLNTDLAMAWPVNTVGTARGIYVMGWAATTYVATPNNGLNFWTVTLFLDGSAASQFTTASDTAGAQTVHINAVVAAYAAGGQRLLINITKTGSPGVLYSPLFVEYRKIAT